MTNVITLEKLKSNMCKWPFGDPKHDDFHFCGTECDVGIPYCQKHIEEAYQARSTQRVTTKVFTKKAA